MRFVEAVNPDEAEALRRFSCNEEIFEITNEWMWADARITSGDHQGRNGRRQDSEPRLRVFRHGT
ncbi:hypothetical protein ACWKWK_03160 [Pseudoxanthomonas beigongshangi]